MKIKFFMQFLICKNAILLECSYNTDFSFTILTLILINDVNKCDNNKCNKIFIFSEYKY